jgi:hypothetical protein
MHFDYETPKAAGKPTRGGNGGGGGTKFGSPEPPDPNKNSRDLKFKPEKFKAWMGNRIKRQK